jgi:hypothetical protein
MPKRPPLTVPQLLAWCDAHHARTGSWPRTSTTDRTELPQELNWRRIDNALHLGLRTLPGGSSLAQLLAEQRGVRNKQDLPPLTHDVILAWADQHHERTGSWPNEDSDALAVLFGVRRKKPCLRKAFGGGRRDRKRPEERRGSLLRGQAPTSGSVQRPPLGCAPPASPRALRAVFAGGARRIERSCSANKHDE